MLNVFIDLFRTFLLRGSLVHDCFSLSFSVQEFAKLGPPPPPRGLLSKDIMYVIYITKRKIDDSIGCSSGIVISSQKKYYVQRFANILCLDIRKEAGRLCHG